MTPKRRSFAYLASACSACVLAILTSPACSDDGSARPKKGCSRPEGCGKGGGGAAGEGPGGAPAGGVGEGGDESQGGSRSGGTNGGSGKSGTGGSSGSRAGEGGTRPTGGVGGASLGGTGGAGTGGATTGGAGGGGCTTELLLNGDFDGQPPWTESALPSGYELLASELDVAAALRSPFQANTSPNVVWLGGVAGDTQAAYQTIVIPATALSLRVSGTVLIATELETPANGDQASIGFTDATSALPLLDWGPLDASDAWAPFSLTFDASMLAGRTLNFGIGATTDGTGNTNFFFDSLSLEVCP